MHVRELDYDLPPHLIAQHPSSRRDQSCLLVVNRGGFPRAHVRFRDLSSYLAPGDLLVLNNTRVLPARLFGHKARTGGKWEGLFLGRQPDGAWDLMCQTRGRPDVGEVILVEPPDTAVSHQPLELRLEGRTGEGHWLVRPDLPGDPVELLGLYGHIPLPPYIRKGLAEAADQERYQTIFARHPGSVAAPTAGLHFTPEVFQALEQRDITRTFVTLHVGAGTFQPIQVEDVGEHRVQAEWCEVSAETVKAIATCRQRGGRVIAVGTTTTRTLETVAAIGPLRPWSGASDLTIAPPFSFRVVDGLITNFHLPRSSLLLLTAAFTGWESLKESYRIAIQMGYRFYSYGDAMLIAPDHDQSHPPHSD
jgi:S-adenosylmethionine:tRNA ribosyltransferase-isomerase